MPPAHPSSRTPRRRSTRPTRHTEQTSLARPWAEPYWITDRSDRPATSPVDNHTAQRFPSVTRSPQVSSSGQRGGDLVDRASRGVAQPGHRRSGPQHRPARGRQHVASRITEDALQVGRAGPCAPIPGASSGARLAARSISSSATAEPTVAPTTSPTLPRSSDAALSAAAPATMDAATDRPSASRACCTDAPSAFDVSASTNTPAPWRAAMSSAGRREPYPR